MKNIFYTLIVILIFKLSIKTYALDNFERKYDNNATFGINMTDGNSKTFLSNVSIISKSKSTVDEIITGLEANYGRVNIKDSNGRSKDETNIKNGKIYAQYKWLTDELNYIYINVDLSKDDIAEIDYRLQAGPGYGHYLIKNDHTSLVIELGATYIKDDVAGLEDNRFAIRLGERFDCKLSDSSKIWESIEYLPTIDDFDNYLLNSEIGIDSAINTNFLLRFVIQDKLNNQPAPGKEKNDLILITGVGYKF